jgi:hypothetical protein
VFQAAFVEPVGRLRFAGGWPLPSQLMFLLFQTVVHCSSCVSSSLGFGIELRTVNVKSMEFGKKGSCVLDVCEGCVQACSRAAAWLWLFCLPVWYLIGRWLYATYAAATCFFQAGQSFAYDLWFPLHGTHLYAPRSFLATQLFVACLGAPQNPQQAVFLQFLTMCP